MSDLMEDSPTDTLEQTPERKGIFYRTKRFFFSLLASFCVLFLTDHPFIAFVSYVLSGLFWDWWFFTHDGCRDSAQAPKSYFEAIGIIPQQIDEFNEFMVKVRRAAFAASISATAACMLSLPNFSYQTVFVITYIGVNFGTMIIAVNSGKIVFPFRFAKKGELVESAYPLSIMDTDCYNAASDNKISNPYA